MPRVSFIIGFSREFRINYAPNSVVDDRLIRVLQIVAFGGTNNYDERIVEDTLPTYLVVSGTTTNPT